MVLRFMTSTPAMENQRVPGRQKSFNLPNILTYGRIAAVPALVILMFWPEEFWFRWAALGVYSAAAITDFFDGYLARAWSQQSAIGRMLDPIADKLLVAGCLVMLVADGTIRSYSIWAAIVILSREILVSGLREFLAELRVSVPVSTLAKWKTTVQLIALGFLVVGNAGDVVLSRGVTVSIGLGMLWAAAILTFVTGWDYLKSGIRHLIEEDEKAK